MIEISPESRLSETQAKVKVNLLMKSNTLKLIEDLPHDIEERIRPFLSPTASNTGTVKVEKKISENDLFIEQ